MNFGEILKKAWNVSWKNKLLWLFALFGPLAGGTSFNFNSSNYRFSDHDMGSYQYSGDWGYQISEFFNNINSIFLILAIVGFVLVMIVISVILNIYGTAGVILGTSGVIAEDKKPKFKELIKSSSPYFWKLLLLNVVLFLLGIAAFIAFIIGTVMTLGLLVCLIILLIPVFYLVNIYLGFVYVAMVKDNLNLMEAFKKAWELFRDNFTNNIIWALIIGIGKFVINMIVGLVMIVIGVLLAIVIAAAVDQTSGILIALAIVLGLMMLAYVIFLFVFSAFESSFVWSTIILIYNEYDSEKEELLLISDESEQVEDELDKILEDKESIVSEKNEETKTEEKEDNEEEKK